MSSGHNDEVFKISQAPQDILAPPMRAKNTLQIWCGTQTEFPCFDDRDLILPYIKNFYPASAVITCVISHDSLVAYNVEVNGWLTIPLIIFERREFRPTLHKYELKKGKE